MLSIILPTYNEAENLPELLERIDGVMGTHEFEVIVVDDDSPDGTWRKAEELKKKHAHLRVLRRVGRSGLSSAVAEGFDMAKGNVLMVMDADLQHDPVLILRLLDKVNAGADIAVASRYIEGGGVGDWIRGRRILSNAATYLAKAIPPVHVSDPMSGFFAMKRASYEGVRSSLRPSGFKILLEILAFLPASSVSAEVPLQFQMRRHGESKLNLRVEMVFLWQLLRIALIRIQWPLFWGACFVTLIALCMRVWPLRMMYLNPVVRHNVETTLRRVSDQNGWLLSDLSVRSVTGNSVTVIHRAHVRGEDPSECFVLPYDDSPVQPCVN